VRNPQPAGSVGKVLADWNSPSRISWSAPLRPKRNEGLRAFQKKPPQGGPLWHACITPINDRSLSSNHTSKGGATRHHGPRKSSGGATGTVQRGGATFAFLRGHRRVDLRSNGKRIRARIRLRPCSVIPDELLVARIYSGGVGVTEPSTAVLRIFTAARPSTTCIGQRMWSDGGSSGTMDYCRTAPQGRSDI